MESCRRPGQATERVLYWKFRTTPSPAYCLFLRSRKTATPSRVADPSVAVEPGVSTKPVRHLRRAARWLLVFFVLLTSAIGFLFLTRGTAVQRVRGLSADGAPIAPAESTFAIAVAVLTGAVLSPGNRIELALDGNGTYPRLWA